MTKNLVVALCALPLTLMMQSCGSSSSGGAIGKKGGSSTTGWAYNDPKNGGFQKINDFKNVTGPGLVPIEGGTFIMGALEQDLGYDNNNKPRRVTVSSFYMDETEVRNIDWLEYLYWIGRVYKNYPQVYQKALPDTLVWRRPLAYNEPYVTNYLRHPSSHDYPVVGVSHTQASEYCIWRTDRVNEQILISKGIQKPNLEQSDANTFNTDAYYAGQYEGVVNKNVKNLNPNAESKTRPVNFSDGILLPSMYRLPTEAEWEYAALAIRSGRQPENVEQSKIYPWKGLTLRHPSGKTQGLFMANFKRGRGDNAGVAGFLNDQAEITAPVKSYLPNDFGLYCMAGNVNEWVQDVYRPLSLEDINDLNPFRGNEYTVMKKDSLGAFAEKDSLGRMVWVPDTVGVLANGEKVARAHDMRGEKDPASDYGYGTTSMVNNHSRVYKGGSWNDRAYWLTPGARRFMDQDSSSADLGFRCAMGRVGSAVVGKSKVPVFSKSTKRQ